MTVMYAFRNTERGIRERGSISRFIEPTIVCPTIVRTIEQIRAEKRAEAIQARREDALIWSAKVEQARLEALSASAVASYRMIDVRQPKTPVRALIERVATFHEIPYEVILGPRRDKKAVAARFDAIKAVHDARPDLSTPQIGKHFNRDHTSILHALGRLKTKLSEG